MNFNEPIDCDCLIAGDDQEAKVTVAKLIDKLPGVQTVDCGPLERAQIIEKITTTHWTEHQKTAKTLE